jgi:leucyl/phenylalanyl-tRNA--protein transferase
MGFRMIPRSEFLRILGEDAGEGGKPGRWTVEATPEEVASWQPETGQAAVVQGG